MARKTIHVPDAYHEAREIYRRLEEARDEAAMVVSQIAGPIKGPFGLTPEHIRMSPEYKQARARYWDFHERTRDYAKAFIKKHKTEYYAELRETRKERVQEYWEKKNAEGHVGHGLKI